MHHVACLVLTAVHYFSLQETYDTIPGQNKITFLLQAIRDATAAEEVCTLNTDVCILTHVKVFQPELGKLQRSYFSFFSLSRGSASVFFVSSKPLSQYKSLTETILFLAFV